MSKILIIEDDQIVANIYRNKFSVEGYDVEIAPDGEVGLQSIRNFRPDAVVLDLMMPKLTGVDLMKKVRAEQEFQHLPIIVFSNTYLTNLVQEAWKAGATKCLSKANCTPKQVIDIVRSAITKNVPHALPAPANPAPPQPPDHEHHPQLPHHPKNTTAASPPPPAVPEQVTRTDPDAEFQAELRKSFIDSLPGTLTALRSLLKSTIKADDEMARLKQVHEMYRHIHALTANAAMTGITYVAQMSDALEALLKELYEKPKNINASTLRTVAAAVDFLAIIFERGLLAQQQEMPPASILVVDDEAISRRAVTYALDKAHLKCVSVENPEAAYNLLLQNKFDLVFLDVDMPNMNGFELCSKLRNLPTHKNTPVIFVTSLNDFENRANSTMSGGNDFIAKPFLFIELAVKALGYVLRGRVDRAKHNKG